MHESSNTAKGEGMSGCDCHLRSARASELSADICPNAISA